MSDLIDRQAAIDAIMGQPPEPHYPSWYAAQIEKLPAAQPATNCSEIPNSSDETISRQAAIELIERMKPYHQDADDIAEMITNMPSAQPDPMSEAYTKAVFTWLLEYQIKAAELKGRYTPYEVLSWVVNDWRKEHEGSD